MQQCRPITVFAAIYRLYASGITRFLFEEWLHTMPEGICGALPGRSSWDATLALELRLESAMQAGVTALGYSIDLSKF